LLAYSPIQIWILAEPEEKIKVLCALIESTGRPFQINYSEESHIVVCTIYFQLFKFRQWHLIALIPVKIFMKLWKEQRFTLFGCLELVLIGKVVLLGNG
jgi:hypothetical protein